MHQNNKSMIKAIGNKRVSLTEEEFAYFLELKKTFGDDEFRDLFCSDNNGNIITITPPIEKTSSLIVIFFLLNVMLNQRLRRVDHVLSKFSDIENRLSDLENKT